MIFSKKREQQNITCLSLGRLVSSLGSHVFNFALSLYVLDISGSAAFFSAVLGLAIIPNVLINLFGGVWIDEKNKKNLMVITDLMSAILVFSFVPIFHYFSENLSLIIAYTITLSALHAANDLTISCAIPEIVNQEGIPKANSFLQIIATLLSVIGPILGAVLYFSIGMHNILLLDGISFLLAAIFSLFLVLRARNTINKTVELNYKHKFKAGYSYLMKQPLMRFLVLLAILLNGIYMPLMLLVIPYINYQVIKVSGTQLSFIEASWAVGATLGGIYMATRIQIKHYIPKLFILLSLQAILIFTWVSPAYFDFSHSKWLVTLFFSVILVVTGVLNMIQNIPLLSYVQAEIPEELRGRVLGLINVFILASTPVGIFIYGVLLQHFTWTNVVMGSASLILLISIFAHKTRTFSIHSKAIQ